MAAHVNNLQSSKVRPILTHQPSPGGITMNDDEYYEYIGTMLSIRRSSGTDELSSKTWAVDAEVRQWNGGGGSFFVQVWNDALLRAGITPAEAVDDKQ